MVVVYTSGGRIWEREKGERARARNEDENELIA